MKGQIFVLEMWLWAFFSFSTRWYIHDENVGQNENKTLKIDDKKK